MAESSVLGGKKWFQSLTAWGLIVLGAGQAAEQTGVLPPGTTAQGQETSNALVALINSVGGLLTVLGLRRAANPT